MRKNKLIYTVFLLFAFIISCKGQNQPEQTKDSHNSYLDQLGNDLFGSNSVITDFNIISIPNAPSRITRKIRQDNDGNLLFAAYEDILQYDGKSFTNFTKEAGLDSCDAFDVMEDTKGNIWIASTHLGAFRYDGQSFTHFTPDDGLAHIRTMCLYEDRAGNIWIGTQGGASCYNGKSFRSFTTKEGMTHNDINTIMEDKTGKIWFGTRGTACVYDPSTSTFTEIKNDDGRPFENVWSIVEDKNGNIWLSSGGLWLYDGLSFTKMTTESGNSIYEDKKGNIWFTHSPPDNKSALSRFDEKALQNKKPIATQIFKGDGMFLGISEDKDGNIWVGGGDGAWCYYGKTVTYFTGVEVKE